MSTATVGRLLDENGTPWANLTVALYDVGALFDVTLDQKKTSGDGKFRLEYYENSTANQFGNRQLELVVYDSVKRVLHRLKRDDTNAGQIDIGDLTIRRADATGFLVTLGQGKPQFLSQGNAVKLLMDRDAFEQASQLFENATSTILISQLFFDIPQIFNADAAREDAELVFKFASEPEITKPRDFNTEVARPERILLRKAVSGVTVNILVNAVQLPFFLPVLIGVGAFLFGGSDGVFAAKTSLRDMLTDVRKIRQYFDASGQPRIKAYDFPQPILNHGVMHAKLIIVDGKHAISIGSPFSQSYVDTPAHRIDDPRRLRSGGLPKHDAGFGVTGPALADLHATMSLLWNTVAPAQDQIRSIPTPPAQTEGGEAITALQIVRTLSAGRFDQHKDGEKGILEAYQRAIANAQDFIYFETQYFTNDAIGDALIEALKAKPALQVIVLVNIAPDVPFYPFKQRRLITRIRKAVGDVPPGARPRFGVFTRWTHETSSPRPRILPIYIHSKAAIVDNTWATIGSANLDGLSLDSSLFSDIFRPFFGTREQRAIEVNGVMYNGVDGQPQTGAIELLRKQLWAEHLGYTQSDNTPDKDHRDLQQVDAMGWLGLWQRRATEKLQQLREKPAQSQATLAHVLPWPEKNSTYKTPRIHLNALGVRTHAVVPLKSTRKFVFDKEEKTWKDFDKDKKTWKDPFAPMDYP